jgi:hypothetical protein
VYENGMLAYNIYVEGHIVYNAYGTYFGGAFIKYLYNGLLWKENILEF